MGRRHPASGPAGAFSVPAQQQAGPLAPPPGGFLFDEALRSHHGAAVIVGVDEAGRGPLAGPVVAAAVALDGRRRPALDGVRDSKALAEARREELFLAVRRHALWVGVGWALPDEIDRAGILAAALSAMRRAIERRGAPVSDALVAVDGLNEVPGLGRPQRALVKGDAFSLAIGAASVVAKVVRDRWMAVLDRGFPGYGFAEHKGYGTARHLEAIARLGPSPVHRRSFEPVRQATLPLGEPLALGPAAERSGG